MQLITILNHCHKFKRFVYKKAQFVETEQGQAIEVTIEPRRNSRAICSQCGQEAPLYDRLQPRRFEFIPLWGYAVFFLYLMRRVQCGECEPSCPQNIPIIEQLQEVAATLGE